MPRQSASRSWTCWLSVLDLGLSLPEAVTLRKVLRPKIIAVYFGVVALGILVEGHLFNVVF
jgi:uncharacterized membrane protein YraQ (UPF0718 family)